MANILLIDGCMRGWEVSNTYSIAEKFMESYLKANPDDTIEEIHLSEESITCLTAKEIDQHDRLLGEGQLEAPEFEMAHRFAKADKILLVAPLWNMTLPSAVIAYFERVCMRSITFSATAEHGMQGKCVADKLLCVMTSGDMFGEDGDDRSVASYLRSLCNMLGIHETMHLWIEGLQIEDGEANDRLQQGIEEAIELASAW